VYSPSSIKAAVSPSYSPIEFTNRSSNSPPTRLTWKLLSPLVCVASTTVNPTDRDVLLYFGTAPGERLRLGLVDLFGRFGFWLFLGVGICGFLFGRLCVRALFSRCWLVWLFSLFGRSVAAPLNTQQLQW